MNATLFRLLERLASRQRLMGEVLLLPRTPSPSSSVGELACQVGPAREYRFRRT